MRIRRIIKKIHTPCKQLVAASRFPSGVQLEASIVWLCVLQEKTSSGIWIFKELLISFGAEILSGVQSVNVADC